MFRLAETSPWTKNKNEMRHFVVAFVFYPSRVKINLLIIEVKKKLTIQLKF
jgi:hypothetical protein